MARILIVDDEESIRETLGAIAKKCEHTVALASDAPSALEQLKQEPFDVVVSDIILPRRTGIALLGDIRVLQPDAQVIMITGEPEVETAAEAVRKGAFDYLAKPVKRAHFEQVLQAAASRKDLLDRNSALEKENRDYRDHLEKLVERRTRELRLINEAARTLALARSIEDVYETAYRSVSSHMDAPSFIISVYDEDSQLLTAGYARFDGQAFDVSRLPSIPLADEGMGTQSQVIHTRSPLYIDDYQKARANITTEYTIDDRNEVVSGPPHEDEEDVIRSAIYVPLLVQGDIIGVIQVQSVRLDAYTESDMSLLQGLSGVVSVAIENARLLEGTRDALYGTVDVLGRSAELRDPYTAGHQRRVASLACAIGQAMKLRSEQLEGLRVAALLHDVGKTAVPAEILSKPGTLSNTEFGLIQQHPQTAYELLSRTRFPWPVAETVLQHHERLDGSGYPAGLAGDEIILEARILAVCDVVEAMSSHRPYRPALGIEVALSEIEEHRGELYDPAAVDACLSIFSEKSFSFDA